MPQRQNVHRIDSATVQGEGSYVELRRFTVAEARQYFEDGKRADFDEFETSLGIIRTHVVGWNWVDDDGKPMPLPAADPEVVSRLTDDEVRLIGRALRGPTEAALGN